MAKICCSPSMGKNSPDSLLARIAKHNAGLEKHAAFSMAKNVDTMLRSHRIDSTRHQKPPQLFLFPRGPPPPKKTPPPRGGPYTLSIEGMKIEEAGLILDYLFRHSLAARPLPLRSAGTPARWHLE